MSGPAHLPYLLCSLKTLRQQYHGEVVVFAWKESLDIVKLIAEDKNLNIQVKSREPAHRLKNAQFMDKIELAKDQCGERDILLYLDADTTIHSTRIVELFDAAEKTGFAGTRFNNWTTNTGIIANRLKDLRQYKRIHQKVVEELLLNPWPSVNGGVWACRPDTPVLPVWSEWTNVARKLFIADEVVLHTLMPLFAPSKLFVMLGEQGEFNTSPKFISKILPEKDVVVKHYHGDSNVRIDKSRVGYDWWWPIFQKCLDENTGNVTEWISLIQNRWMDKLEEFLSIKKRYRG